MLTKIMRYFRYGIRLIYNPKIVVIDGVKLDVSRLDKKMKYLVYGEGWESEERFLLKKHKPKISSLLELGTCIGYLSIFAEKYLKIDHVVSLDANPALADLVNKNKMLNKSNMEFINAVVGSKEKYNFYINKDIISSSLTNKADTIEHKIVKGILFDSLIDYAKPDFIIIDIEGGEYELILKNSFPIQVKGLLIEFHGINNHSGKSSNMYPECISKLKEDGFQLIDRKNRIHYFKRK